LASRFQAPYVGQRDVFGYRRETDDAVLRNVNQAHVGKFFLGLKTSMVTDCDLGQGFEPVACPISVDMGEDTIFNLIGKLMAET
jgi:hypothetical protein